MRRLEGKRVVVTGGTSGIGAATSRRFVEEGARVVSIALGDEEEAVEGLEGALVADVADPAAVASAFAEVDELLGGLDVLVANAGISVRRPFVAASSDEWRRVLAVNLEGVLVCAQEAARRMGGGETAGGLPGGVDWGGNAHGGESAPAASGGGPAPHRNPYAGGHGGSGRARDGHRAAGHAESRADAGGRDCPRRRRPRDRDARLPRALDAARARARRAPEPLPPPGRPRRVRPRRPDRDDLLAPARPARRCRDEPPPGNPRPARPRPARLRDRAHGRRRRVRGDRRLGRPHRRARLPARRARRPRARAERDLADRLRRHPRPRPDPALERDPAPADRAHARRDARLRRGARGRRGGGARLLGRRGRTDGRPGLSLIVSVAGMVLTAGAAVVLVPRLGGSGAAVASSIGYAGGAVLAWWFFARLARARLAQLA